MRTIANHCYCIEAVPIGSQLALSILRTQRLIRIMLWSMTWRLVITWVSFQTIDNRRRMAFAWESETGYLFLVHDDVIKWKYFPRYWPFARGIHRLPVNSPHKGQWRGALRFLWFALNKRLSKQWRGWWFETPSRSLWHHCNANARCMSFQQGFYAGLYILSYQLLI